MIDDVTATRIWKPLHESSIRTFTHSRILRGIAQQRGGGLRRELAKALEISPATVGKSVALLDELGLIHPERRRPAGGRPTGPLQLTREFAMIGIAVITRAGKPHRMLGTVVYLDGTPLPGFESPRVGPLEPPASGGLEFLVDQLAAFACSLAETDIGAAHYLGCGISLGGHVDNATGQVKQALSASVDLDAPPVQLRDGVQERLRLPVVLGNDIASLAIRKNLRPSQPADNYALVVPIDLGVGGALVVHGRVWSGSSQAAGEPGHIPVPGTSDVKLLPGEPEGTPEIHLKYPVPRCQCETAKQQGASGDDTEPEPAGHVEAFASPYAIEQRALQNRLVDTDTGIRELAARHHHDREIGLLFYQGGLALGSSIVPIIDWFDPRHVRVYLPSDELHQPNEFLAGQYYLKGLHRQLQRTAFITDNNRPESEKILQIKRLTTGELHDGLASAAAYLVFRRILRILTGEEQLQVKEHHRGPSSQANTDIAELILARR